MDSRVAPEGPLLIAVSSREIEMACGSIGAGMPCADAVTARNAGAKSNATVIEAFMRPTPSAPMIVNPLGDSRFRAKA